MKVFISWSGPLSERLGQSIRDWLPNVIQSVDPYFTPSDVDKGARWLSEITNELNDSTVGVLCVTQDNINSDWLLFEAGALSTKLEKSHVCPVLFGIKPTDLSGPMKQFQATNFEQEDFRKLVSTVNTCLEEKLPQKTLDTVFEKWWPDLEGEITKILDVNPQSDEPIRSDRDILEELLQLTISHSRSDRDILEELLQLTKSRSASRGPINQEAIRILLEAYIELHDQQASRDGDYQATLNSLRDMHKPIQHIVARSAERSDNIRELFNRFRDLSYKCLPKEEPNDDDLPF